MFHGYVCSAYVATIHTDAGLRTRLYTVTETILCTRTVESFGLALHHGVKVTKELIIGYRR